MSGPGMSSDGTRRNGGALAVAVFLLLYAAYLLAFKGSFRSIDEMAMFSTLESIATGHGLGMDQLQWLRTTEVASDLGKAGPSGELYSWFEPAQIGLALPLYHLATRLLELSPVPAVFLFNPLVTALTGGLVALFLLGLGFSRGVAVVTALLVGLATPAWPYAETFFREPLTGLGVLVAGMGALRGGWRGALASGLGGGLVVLTKEAMAPALALVAPLFLPWGSGPRFRSGRAWGPLLLWVALVLGAVVSQQVYEGLKLGDPLQTKIPVEHQLRQVQGLSPALLAERAYGLLLSPGRGLFVFAPVLVLAILGLPELWRRRRAAFWLSAGLPALLVAEYATYDRWWGGVAWGPRYLIPALPLLALPLAIFVESQKRSWARRAALLVLAAASFAIQILAVGTDYVAGLAATLDQFPDQEQAWQRIIFDPAFSPILSQASRLFTEPLDFVGRSVTPEGTSVDWGMVLSLLGLGGLASLGLMGRLWGLRASVALVAAGSLLVPIASVAAIAAADRASREADLSLAQALQAVAEAARPGDGLVVLLPLESGPTLSGNRRLRPHFGLPELKPPLPAWAEPVLERAVARHPRLWLVSRPSWDPPWERGVTAWLSQRLFRVEERLVENVEVALYEARWPERFSEIAPRTEFGGRLRLGRAKLDPGPVRSPGVLRFVISWEVVKPVDGLPTLFVHLTDATGSRLAGADGPLAQGSQDPSTWQPGATISHRGGLPLLAELPPGRYQLRVGLYGPASSERWTVATPDGQNSLVLGEVEVLAP